MELSRRRAAGLGALAGVAWASAFMVTSTVVLRAQHARWPFSGGPWGLFSIMGFFAPSAGEPEKWLYFWPAAGVAGALVGLVGRTLRLRPWARMVTLWLTFFPSVTVGMGSTMWIVVMVNNLQGKSFDPLWKDALVLPGTVLMAAIGSVMLAPVLAWPLLAAAVTTEAWTRPTPTTPAKLGLPRAQIALLASLVLVVAIGLMYLRVSWEEIPGGSWLAP